MNGKFLKEKLQKSDVQFVELAKKLNISPQNLYNKFKSKDLSLSFLVDVSLALNKSIYFLMSGSGRENLFLPEDSDLGTSEPRDFPYKDVLLIETQKELLEAYREKIAMLEAELEKAQSVKA